MSESRFWDSTKSVTLSIVVTWVGLAGGLACVPLLVPALKLLRPQQIAMDASYIVRVSAPLYVCLAFGMVALVVLLFLLRDIRRGAVFTPANVHRLRLISYCGFAIMVACVVGALISPLHPIFVFLAVIAGFLGLLMRVVKNVIDTARLLKEDADFTI